MKAFIRKFIADRAGVAVTEFALGTTLLFMVVLAGLDFGGYFIQRGQINEAVSAAAMQSFQQRENVSFGNLQSYVRNLADSQTVTVTTSCNGTANSCTNLNRTCACLQTNGTYTATACGTACSGGATSGSTAGYYLTIEASDLFRKVVLPKGVFGGDTVSQSVTVRLQ